MKTRKLVHTFITSTLVLGMSLLASAESLKLNLVGNQFVIDRGITEDNVDKIISNVKVSYNPIAHQLVVIFKVAKQGVVVVKLMDALGNEVMNLSNSTLDGGTHSLSFDTESKLSEGVYFVRVSLGSEIVTKRVVIR